jgi:hypothetical protein
LGVSGAGGCILDRVLPPSVTDLARANHGVVTRPQLLELAFSSTVVDGWVRAEHLEKVVIAGVPLVGTYRVRGCPDFPEQSARAAVERCRPRAALTGPVVLGGLGIEGFTWSSTLMVRVPLDRWVTGVPFTVLRDPLFDKHRATVGEMDGSTPTRAIMDTALTVRGKPLVTAIDSAKFKSLTSNGRLEQCAAPLAALGHAGAITVQALLADGLLQQESHGERAMAPILSQLQPPVRWQHWISSEIRVDAALADVPISVEYLGKAEHGGAVKQAEDAERHRQVRRLGWHPIYVLKEHLREPAVLLARILGARDALLAAGIRCP